MGDGILRLDFDGGWSIRQLSEFLGAVRYAYGSVLHFEHSIDSRETYRSPRMWRGEFPLLVVEAAREPEPSDSWITTMTLVGEPQLKSIHIASPGWVEVLGKWNPLSLIADFIRWWPNRDLDRARIENDVERGSLENLLLQNQILKERFELLVEMGHSKRKARELLAIQTAKPLLGLEPFVEGKSIRAEVKALPEGKRTRRVKKTEEPAVDFTPVEESRSEEELVPEEPQDRDDDPNSER